MKKLISTLFTTFAGFISMNAQEKTKDTLYFAVDQHYTISPTITANLFNQKKVNQFPNTNLKRKYTNTNGYIYFIGDGFLTTGLKPKKILSIKDFIENREFYVAGKYNNMIDIYKFQDSLINKYIIFFVNGNEFIRPRHLEYIWHHPERDNNGSLIKNPTTKKDTLFFSVDNNYTYQSKFDKKNITIKDNTCFGGGSFYFEEKQIININMPKQILHLKQYIHSSKFYDPKKQMISCYALGLFMDNYEIIFIRKNQEQYEFINAQAIYAVED
jgi:hypothetical protein